MMVRQTEKHRELIEGERDGGLQDAMISGDEKIQRA